MQPSGPHQETQVKFVDILTAAQLVICGVN
jgi:hypothetical protein